MYMVSDVTKEVIIADDIDEFQYTGIVIISKAGIAWGSRHFCQGMKFGFLFLLISLDFSTPLSYLFISKLYVNSSLKL